MSTLDSDTKTFIKSHSTGGKEPVETSSVKLSVDKGLRYRDLTTLSLEYYYQYHSIHMIICIASIFSLSWGGIEKFEVIK